MQEVSIDFGVTHQRVENLSLLKPTVTHGHLERKWVRRGKRSTPKVGDQVEALANRPPETLSLMLN